MKKVKIICIGLAVFIFSWYGSGGSEETATPEVIYKRYAVKSGTVEYIISGTQKGIEIVYFDDWGMREARYKKAESEMLGLLNRLTVREKDWVYTIDLDKRLGTKVQDLEMKQILDESAQGNDVNVSERLMTLWEAVSVGETKLMEKSCKIWTVEKTGQKFWLWNWLPLKSETKTGVNEIILTAVSINLDVPIPSEKFQIPEGIQYIQGDLDSILISAQPQQEKEDL